MRATKNNIRNTKRNTVKIIKNNLGNMIRNTVKTIKNNVRNAPRNTMRIIKSNLDKEEEIIIISILEIYQAYLFQHKKDFLIGYGKR